MKVVDQLTATNDSGSLTYISSTQKVIFKQHQNSLVTNVFSEDRSDEFLAVFLRNLSPLHVGSGLQFTNIPGFECCNNIL